MTRAKKVLVTGASGMLGSDLMKVLRGPYEALGLTRREADITDGSAVHEVFRSVQPEVVLHAAAYTDVDGCEEDRSRAEWVNVAGTKNVCDACNAVGAILIFISSDYVFDGKKSGPYKEDDLPNPLSFYGATKLEGEKYIRSKMPHRCVILRTSWLFGENGRNFIDKIIELARAQKQLKVVDDQEGSPTYTADLALGIRKVLDSTFVKGEEVLEKQIFHLTNSGATTWFELARMILKSMPSRNIELIPMTSDELNRPAVRPKNSVLDNGRYVGTFGEPLRPWRQAVEHFLKVRSATCEELRIHT